MPKKIVLAYSGGLDTSVILKWLQVKYECPVVTFTADLGQGEELDSVKDKAKSLGVEEFFIEKLKENRFKDSISGRTNFSANKTDLVIYDLKKRKEVKNFSTGEQKLIIISIILSFIEFIKTSKTEKLIFLLDDIFSYLDSNYISRLLQELSKLNIQTWITDVRADWISNSPMLKNIIHKINIGDKHFKVPNIKV